MCVSIATDGSLSRRGHRRRQFPRQLRGKITDGCKRLSLRQLPGAVLRPVQHRTHGFGEHRNLATQVAARGRDGPAGQGGLRVMHDGAQCIGLAPSPPRHCRHRTNHREQQHHCVFTGNDVRHDCANHTTQCSHRCGANRQAPLPCDHDFPDPNATIPRAGVSRQVPRRTISSNDVKRPGSNARPTSPRMISIASSCEKACL